MRYHMKLFCSCGCTAETPDTRQRPKHWQCPACEARVRKERKKNELREAFDEEYQNWYMHLGLASWQRQRRLWDQCARRTNRKSVPQLRARLERVGSAFDRRLVARDDASPAQGVRSSMALYCLITEIHTITVHMLSHGWRMTEDETAA